MNNTTCVRRDMNIWLEAKICVRWGWLHKSWCVKANQQSISAAVAGTPIADAQEISWPQPKSSSEETNKAMWSLSLSPSLSINYFTLPRTQLCTSRLKVPIHHAFLWAQHDDSQIQEKRDLNACGRVIFSLPHVLLAVGWPQSIAYTPRLPSSFLF